MARAGSLHVTVISATLLRDAGRCDIDRADAYASVGCGSQNFTTSSIKNHRARPAWNESHTFKFDERSEKESQHILIEIFAEKPKLDELLGLAKIPLQTVITAGNEITTHPLNKPDDEYTSRELYSGHVKVALKWDFAKRGSATAYPQVYTPAARYNPNVSRAKVHNLPPEQTTGPEEQLQDCKSGEELQHPEDNYAPDQDRGVHHRSSSCPSGRQGIFSFAPSPSPLPKADKSSTPQQTTSNVHAPKTYASSRPPSFHSRCHSSYEAPSNAYPQKSENGHGSNRQIPYSGPHVPYITHAGNKESKEMSFDGRAAIVQPVESGIVNSYLKLQDGGAKGKLSKSKQAEMMKLAELSRLTQIAKVEVTNFAKAGQQPCPRPTQTIIHGQEQSQVSSRQVQAPHGLHKNYAQPQQHLLQGHQLPNLQSKQLSVVPNMLDIFRHQSQMQQQDQKPGPLLIRSQRQADIIYEKANQKPEKPEKKKKLGPFRQTLKIMRKASNVFGM